MQLILSSRKVDVTPDVRTYVEEKMGKIGNYFDRVISIRVELERELRRDDGKEFGCEILLSVPGRQLRVGQRGKELYESIDLAEQALQGQIKSFKGKMIDEARQAKESIKNIPDPSLTAAADDDDYEYMYQIGQEPMTLDEAKQQMQLLGHDFYVFTNVETGKTNTVYKKQDGRFGVIVEK